MHFSLKHFLHGVALRSLLPIYFARDEDYSFCVVLYKFGGNYFIDVVHAADSFAFLALALCCSAYTGRDVAVIRRIANVIRNLRSKCGDPVAASLDGHVPAGLAMTNKISILISVFILFVSFVYFRLEGFQTARIYSKHTYSWAVSKINPPAILTSDLIKCHGALQGLHASDYMQTLFQNAKGNPRDLDTQRELVTFKELALTLKGPPLSLRIIVLDILGFERDANWLMLSSLSLC